MSGTFNKQATQNIGTLLMPIYQATVKTVLVSCLLTNKLPGYMSVTLLWRNAAGVDTRLLPNATTRGGTAIDGATGKKLVLLPGDQLLATAPVDAAFDAVVSVLEGVA